MLLEQYLKAGFPALCVVTHEPFRAERLLSIPGHWSFYAWDCQRGIRMAGLPKVVEEIRDPVEAMHWIGGLSDAVLLLHNLHLFLDSADVIQTIQNGLELWKARGSCIVMLSPSAQIRPEVRGSFTLVDLPLPDTESLFDLQKELGHPHNINPNRKAARLARGLTEYEAECAYALSLVQKRYFSSKVVSQLKSQLIRKTGLLEVWEPEQLCNVGGLSQLKQYIRTRARAFLPGNEHLPKPRGILLVGIPGTGKSLSCKAAASILGWPLIRLDIGALKGSLVGESEQKIRNATRIINSFGECVVWIDELEKAFAGVRTSGDTDGGSTSGMFSHFLTWLQEHHAPVLVMATANDVTRLPPETIRAGRFDAVFMVDLPTLPERQEILTIMNQRYGTAIPLDHATRLAGYSGSEIEQLAKEAAFTTLEDAFQSIVPLSRSMREDIEALRAWSRSRARLANTPETQPTTGRKIRTRVPVSPASPLLS